MIRCMNFETINENNISNKVFELYEEYKQNLKLIEKYKLKLNKNIDKIKILYNKIQNIVKNKKDIKNKENISQKKE